jgi:hypothetical protein
VSFTNYVKEVMAASPKEPQPRGTAEFAESSLLEAVVPADSFIDIKDELDSWDGVVEDESSAILPFVPQRQVLLFGKTLQILHEIQHLLLMHRCLDELVPVYIVFRTPLIEDVVLKSYLARLAITLEAFAFGTVPHSESESKGPPPKELIFSGTIKDSNKPTIIRYEEESGPHIYITWKLEVFICKSHYVLV